MTRHVFLMMAALSSSIALASANYSLRGSFEGGFSYGWTGPANGTQWFVDNLRVEGHYDVSDKVRVVLDNAVAVNPTVVTPTTFMNQFNYYPSYSTLLLGSFSFANLGAYIEHKPSSRLFYAVGNLAVPFAMESVLNRYDMDSYYYSQAFTLGKLFGWNYDLGIKATLSEIIPGRLEASLLDGRPVGGNFGPAAAARYSFDFRAGDFGFNPSLSAYLGRWDGGPTDLGLTGGTAIQLGGIFINTELLYLSTKNQAQVSALAAKGYLPAFALGAGSLNVLGFYAEPGIDLGIATVTAKFEYDSEAVTGTPDISDMNVSFALSHSYSGGMRIRLAYSHLGLQGNLKAHINDFRVLFGAKF